MKEVDAEAVVVNKLIRGTPREINIYTGFGSSVALMQVFPKWMAKLETRLEARISELSSISFTTRVGLPGEGSGASSYVQECGQK